MPLKERWSIRSRAHQCSLTGQQFEDGEVFYTAIYPDPESSGYLRKDFSVTAWNNKPIELQQPFSFWQSSYEVVAAASKPEVVSKDSAESLLDTLIKEDQEHTENARYILAVMLERKKILEEIDSQVSSDSIIRIYKHRKTDEVYIIRDPNIALEKIGQLQQEVVELYDVMDP